MKRTTNIPAINGSEMAAGIVSEMVAGAITGVASVRKLFYRTILIVAITVAAASFTIGMMFRDYVTGVPGPAIRSPTPTQEPRQSQQSKPPPKEGSKDKEPLQLFLKDPL